MVVCATEVAGSKPQRKDDTMHTEGAGILEEIPSFRQERKCF